MQHVGAPWHAESFDHFLSESLPALLAERLPVAGFQAEPAGGHACRVTVVVSAGRRERTVTYGAVPRPDTEGVFVLDGRRRVVNPLASDEHLDQATVRCVGEQLRDFVADRLGKAPADLDWDEALVRSLLPLEAWVREFLLDPDRENVQDLEETNWLARATHLRRIRLAKSAEDLVGTLGPWTPGRRRMLAAGQYGRTCPFETPEGINIGRVLHVARGATIRDSRLVIQDDSPAARLGLTASTTPLLAHTDANRVLMGVNMARQWLAPPDPEPALVQTGNEPDAPAFWCGRNLLTAFVAWGVDTYEDALLLSESAAGRLGYPEPLEPGDKLSNRHGQKGVVSRIVPDADMPHLVDGTPADIVCSFMGLHTRLNYGQVREALLGRIAHAKGEPMVVAPFQAPSDQEVRQMLRDAGLPPDGMEVLRSGRDGEPLSRPSTVGWVYWGKTYHVARAKLRLGTDRDQACYQGVTEYTVMREAGTYANVADRFNTAAATRPDAETLGDRLAQGPMPPASPPTPVCAGLLRRLALAGIHADLDDRGLALRLARPEGTVLELAQPVAHPWLPDQSLVEVGAAEDVPEFESLRQANARAQRMVSGGVPKAVAQRSLQQLADRLGQYLDALVEPRRLQMGNRVLFSGRAVIAPGNGLTLEQVGLPEEMACELFGPLVSGEVDGASAVEARSPEASAALDSVMARSWVVVNRAPTLTPTCIVAFRPVRRPGRVIRMHALATPWMNADYDGDQAAVFLPLSEQAQAEAGEMLSVRGHLRRDPSLIRWMAPHQEMLWALADLSRTDEGRQEVTQILGGDLSAPGALVTRNALGDALRHVLERDGVDRAVAVAEELADLGFRRVRASGASLHPLLGSALSRPAPGRDAMVEFVESWTDYDNPAFGPQALAVKSGARGNVWQQTNLLNGLTMLDADGHFVDVEHGLCDGRTPHEVFVAAAGAREGLAETARQVLRGTHEFAYEYYGWRPRGVQGYGVLARAMRAGRPGVVFAHAAATGEVDPLEDIDARLFVGWHRPES